MEKVVTNEMSRYLILLFASLLGLSALLGHMVSKIRGSFKPFRKDTFLYVLVCVLFFGLIALLKGLLSFSDPLSVFIFYQASFLVFGIIHFNLMHKWLHWSGDDKSFWHELLFTFIAGLLGAIGFSTVHRLINKDDLEYVMASSIILFIVPFLFQHTFNAAISIPPKIRKQWFYPVHDEIGEPDEKKLRNLLIISFEFEKQAGDRHFTNFRAKAPGDMEFGELFYYFINDYNERHPNEKIQFINDEGKPYGWIFYRKPRWYSLLTDYKDAEKTIYINNIRENDVIICSRCLS